MGVIVEEISITKKMYGWTKYGGARKGLAVENLDEWSCQLCGRKHPNSMPSYFIPETEDNREFYRVCSSCKKLSLDRDAVFSDLLALKVANLLTLPARY